MITVGNFVITRKHLFISGAPLAGFLLFLFMVALISTGDAGDINKGRKIGNVIMPEREIETLLTDEIEPPQEPETAPPEIAPPQLDVTPIAVSATLNKPQINFNSGSGSMFRDGEYIPLFKVQPVYPRRAQDRGTEGFVIVAFTITESGTIEDVVPVEGYCTSKNPNDPEAQLRPCSIFNSASSRAALKLKYKPKIVDGKAVRVEGVQHKFTFIMEDS